MDRNLLAAAIALIASAAYAAPPGTVLSEYPVTGALAFPANPVPLYDDLRPELPFDGAQYANGDVLVAWRPPNQNAVIARRFRADGSAPKPEFRINASTPAGTVGTPVVAVGPSKQGAAAWSVRDPETETYTVYLRMLRPSDGQPTGGEILVASDVPESYYAWDPDHSFGPGDRVLKLTLAVDDQGTVAVAWGYAGGGDWSSSEASYGIRFYAADGMPIAPPFDPFDTVQPVLDEALVTSRLQEPRYGDEAEPTLHWNDGFFVLSWRSQYANDGCSMRAQRYRTNAGKAGEVLIVRPNLGNECQGDHGQDTYGCAVPMPDGRIAVAWDELYYELRAGPLLGLYGEDNVEQRSNRIGALTDWECKALHADDRYGNLLMVSDSSALVAGVWERSRALQMFSRVSAKPTTSRIPVPTGAQLAGGEATNMTVTLLYPRVVGDLAHPHTVQLVARRYAGPRSQ